MSSCAPRTLIFVLLALFAQTAAASPPGPLGLSSPKDLTDGLFPRHPEGKPITVDKLLATLRPMDPQLSPDGRRVAFTVVRKDLEANHDVEEVWTGDLGTGVAQPFTRDGASEHARWSPDGKRLLVVRSPDGVKPPQLFLYDLQAGGDPRQLTELWGGAQGGVFSPDGRHIAFTSVVYPHCWSRVGREEDACDRQQAEAIVNSRVGARIIDHLFARHWTEWREGKRTHLFVVSATGDRPEPLDLTPGDADWPTWRSEAPDDYTFTRDGRVIVSAKPAAHEAWSTNSDLWAIPLHGGKAQDLTADNRGDDASPRLSPDGRYVAYRSQATEGYESDQWKLKVMDVKTGRSREVGSLENDVQDLRWYADSRALLVSTTEHARPYLVKLTLEGESQPFMHRPSAGDFELLPDGSVVGVVQGMVRPPELFRLSPSGAPQQLTHLNSALFADVDLGPLPEELWVKGEDGVPVHSWVVRPPKLGADGKAPLLLLVHGGPQGSWDDGWSMRWNVAMFASQGYVLVLPDPRGSTGYGRQFERGVSGDWGGKPYTDILRSVDGAEQLPFVDGAHTCAAGASYGGYMINWIAGHTRRFRCLVSHDGVFDLLSMYGSTEELWFPEFEIGQYWKDPEPFRKWSPSSYVQNIQTPTLLVEGERDFRVPGGQALGMFTALQRRGIPSKLLWFPDEGHWVQKPLNSRLWYLTVFDWIGRYIHAPVPAPKG